MFCVGKKKKKKKKKKNKDDDEEEKKEDYIGLPRLQTPTHYTNYYDYY